MFFVFKGKNLKSIIELPIFLATFLEKRKINLTVGEKLVKFAKLVIEWNEKINLTAKASINSFLRGVVLDGCKAADYFDFMQLQSIADIGTGAGVPGLVLKIMFPHLKVFLIEVNKKKIEFLKFAIKELELENIEIVCLDWRTFTRKTNYSIDIFVTKAAILGTEMVRMFRSTSAYKNSAIIYWTSESWQADKDVIKFLYKQIPYSLNMKPFQFVILAESSYQAKFIHSIAASKKHKFQQK